MHLQFASKFRMTVVTKHDNVSKKFRSKRTISSWFNYPKTFISILLTAYCYLLALNCVLFLCSVVTLMMQKPDLIIMADSQFPNLSNNIFYSKVTCKG